ncbi:MAG TPA: RHS repeat-associated core domain-containing protein, partial [Flavobacterium sp.]|nr:RHS repeat-associated core domain-containing protein [Flavobacterium sp.]
MTLPGRTSSSTAYRYGFNGMEKDDELKGKGNSYDYGARMYDPRVGRWFARDPSESTYPSYSTYNYVLNNPIYLIDPNGKSPFDWYKNKLGNYVYDKNIKSQKNLDDAGIDGDYLTNPTLHHYVNGQGVNSYQLNADGTVWDNYTTYMDNFGEIEVGNSGV